MTPLARFGLERGWDTILQVSFIVVTMVLCTMYIVRTMSENAAVSQTILDETRKSIQAQIADRAANQKNVSDRLDVINQRDQLILDRSAFNQTLLEQLRKRGR